MLGDDRYSWETADVAKAVLEAMFLVLALFLVFLEVQEFMELNEKEANWRAYFGYLWNLVDIGCLILIIGIYTLKVVLIVEATRDPTSTFAIYSPGMPIIWHGLHAGLNSILVLVMIARFFKYLSFSSHLAVVGDTLAASVSELSYFFLILAGIASGYAIAGYYFFGNSNLHFATLNNSIRTVFLMSLGEIDTELYIPSDLSLGIFNVIFQWSFILLVLFVVVNMFLAIVMGAYERIREDIKRYDSERTQRNLYPAPMMSAKEWFSPIWILSKRSRKKEKEHFAKINTKEAANGIVATRMASGGSEPKKSDAETLAKKDPEYPTTLLSVIFNYKRIKHSPLFPEKMMLRMLLRAEKIVKRRPKLIKHILHYDNSESRYLVKWRFHRAKWDASGSIKDAKPEWMSAEEMLETDGDRDKPTLSHFDPSEIFKPRKLIAITDHVRDICELLLPFFAARPDQTCTTFQGVESAVKAFLQVERAPPALVRREGLGKPTGKEPADHLDGLYTILCAAVNFYLSSVLSLHSQRSASEEAAELEDMVGCAGRLVTSVINENEPAMSAKAPPTPSKRALAIERCTSTEKYESIIGAPHSIISAPMNWKEVGDNTTEIDWKPMLQLVSQLETLLDVIDLEPEQKQSTGWLGCKSRPRPEEPAVPMTDAEREAAAAKKSPVARMQQEVGRLGVKILEYFTFSWEPHSIMVLSRLGIYARHDLDRLPDKPQIYEDTYWTKSGANGAFCLNLANYWKEKREIDKIFEDKLEETLENAQSEAQRKSWEQRLRDGMAEKQKKIRQKVNMLTQDECREIFEEGKYNSAKDDRDQSKAKKLYELLKKQKGKVQDKGKALKDKGKALKDKGKALKDNLKEKGNRAFSGSVKKMETAPPGGVQTARTLPGIDDPHQPLNDDDQPAEPLVSGPDEGDSWAHKRQRLKQERTIRKNASGQKAESKLPEDQRSWKGRTFPFVFEKGFGAKLMDRFGSMREPSDFSKPLHDAETKDGEPMLHPHEEGADLAEMQEQIKTITESATEDLLTKVTSTLTLAKETTVVDQTRDQVKSLMDQMTKDLQKLQNVDESLRGLKDAQDHSMGDLRQQLQMVVAQHASAAARGPASASAPGPDLMSGLFGALQQLLPPSPSPSVPDPLPQSAPSQGLGQWPASLTPPATGSPGPGPALRTGDHDAQGKVERRMV